MSDGDHKQHSDIVAAQICFAVIFRTKVRDPIGVRAQRLLQGMFQRVHQQMMKDTNAPKCLHSAKDQ